MERLKKEGPVKIKAFGQDASGPFNDPGMSDDHQLLIDDWHYREGVSVPLMLGDPDPGQYWPPGFMGRLVSLMGIHSSKDENPIWGIRSKQMVDRLQDPVIEKGDSASLPMASIAPGAVVDPDMALATGAWASLNGWLLEGPAHHDSATGDEPSLNLGNKLARYVKDLDRDNQVRWVRRERFVTEVPFDC